MKHVVGDTQGFFEVLIHKGPNEVIKTRLSGSKAAEYVKLLLVTISGIEHTSVTNLADEFKNIVCHYVKGICGLLNLGLSEEAVWMNLTSISSLVNESVTLK